MLCSGCSLYESFFINPFSEFHILNEYAINYNMFYKFYCISFCYLNIVCKFYIQVL